MNGPTSKPVAIYDGDCEFCKYCVDRWKRLTGSAVTYTPAQDLDSLPSGVSVNDLAGSIYLLNPDGTHSKGAEAVFRILSHSKGFAVLWWLYRKVPPFARFSEDLYTKIAAQREAFSKHLPAHPASDLVAEDPRPFDTPAISEQSFYNTKPEPLSSFSSTVQSHSLTCRLFLILLGASYFFAFYSLGSQVEGLIGEQGILPAQELLSAIEKNYQGNRFLLIPSLFWIDSSDTALRLACHLGTGLSLALCLGLAPRLSLFGLWVLYLSLFGVGREFLQFQWDILLLEAGFIAIWLLPRGNRSEPSVFMLWLLRWLTFRLMFFSGLVKLTSGDPTWRNLTALNFHYETQPLPNRVSWYAHQLPSWFQEGSVLAMFAIELVVPLLIFTFRTWRAGAAVILIAFQILLELTGNFAFFNVLSIALCVTLFDDTSLKKLLPESVARTIAPKVTEPHTKARLTNCMGAFLVALNLLFAINMFTGGKTLPVVVRSALDAVQPFHWVNTYGLFAVMTTERMEIILEGSADGDTWVPYGFKWKPGALDRAPRFVAPRQPRLDWQMWFAALGNYRSNPWLVQLMVRLMEGSEPVLSLLDKNPFPNAPPRFMRGKFYQYHFTDPETRAKTGAWWTRQLKGNYTPTFRHR